MSETVATHQKLGFLQGGGEMGALARAFPWESTSLGSPFNWPQSLCSTLGILLHSAFPMFLFWGPELLCFYNDAYRPSLGDNGKHPALGKPGREMWPDIWYFIGPLIEQVMSTGEPVWFEDQYLPIFRNGRMEDVYWTFSYSPAYGDSGEIAGVLVTCTEVTARVHQQAELEQQKAHLQNALDIAELGTFVIDLKNYTGTYTEKIRQWFGLEDLQAPISVIQSKVHPDDAAEVARVLAPSLDSEADVRHDITYRIVGNSGATKHYLRSFGKTLYSGGKPHNITGIIQDVTAQRRAEEEKARNTDLLQSVLDLSMVGISVLEAVRDEQGNISDFLYLFANNVTERTVAQGTLLGRLYSDVHPGYRDAGIFKSFYEVTESGVKEERELHYTGEGFDNWFDTQTVKLGDGIVFSFLDVTAAVRDRTALQASGIRFRTVFEQTPSAIGLLTGYDMVVEIANETLLKFWGKGASIIGLPLLEALPEIKDQGFMELLRGVYENNKPFYANAILAKLERGGVLEECYFDLAYTPALDENGKPAGVIVLAIEVTTQVMARKAIEESEQLLRSVVENAPFPIGIYAGHELRIQFANQSIIDIFGKGPEIIGKLYTELLPELEGTGIFEQLRSVMDTGKAIHMRSQRIDLLVNGVMQENYFNYSFTPVYDISGKAYAVMNTAADVTDVVKSKQKIEEAQSSLRGAIELAELGTWEIDLVTRILDYDARTREWFEISADEIITPERAYQPIRESDRPRVKAAIQHAITPGSGGVYDIEYTIDTADGFERILHAQGKAFYNEAGEAYKISGSAQDVTAIRKRQQELERQVQERTVELAANAEALAAANDHLQRSNEELAQYAYVASHDLQEPLRKIRVFSGMIEKQPELGMESRELVGKVEAAAQRMTLLIKDLLEFSRLLNSESLVRPIDLNEICRAVISDFELSIRDKGATLRVGALPHISGVGLQMNQLFYNLLSNALKFSKPDVPPQIEFNSRPMMPAEVNAYIPHANPDWIYYDITIRDNGIGFESKYADQIFEVFKRLHGREVYPGSGIGLALCRRIATNAQGFLHAESTPGDGATFHVILPDRATRPDS